MNTGEELLLRRGIRILETDLPPDADPRHDGLVLARRAQAGYLLKVAVKRGVKGAQRAAFAQWAESTIERLLDSGPDDRWERFSETDQHIWHRPTTISWP